MRTFSALAFEAGGSSTIGGGCSCWGGIGVLGSEHRIFFDAATAFLRRSHRRGGMRKENETAALATPDTVDTATPSQHLLSTPDDILEYWLGGDWQNNFHSKWFTSAVC